MNWDTPFSKAKFKKAIDKMGNLSDELKKHHTGKAGLMWIDLDILDYELSNTLYSEKYDEYIALCKKRNTKLYKALK